ncbi:F0F1 ATP synthase subunit A [Patescibacteria group bacterium]|nr:F0F1 ATP synthase subunit A [Patescibacteria group bacterium]
MVTIALQPDYVARLAGIRITNTFLTSLVVTAILSILAVILTPVGKRSSSRLTETETIIADKLMGFIDGVTGDHRQTVQIFPVVVTLFVFIVTANLLGLIPGFLGSLYITAGSAHLPLLRAPNSDLTTTLALALYAMCAVETFSFTQAGIRGFVARLFNIRSPLEFIISFFESLSELTKIISFSFRLFGNIFAGEVLLLLAAFFLPYILPLPFLVMELFVGVIQAFIFAVLTLAFAKAGSIRSKQLAKEVTI